MKISYLPYLLKFYRPAQTSRETMSEKLTYFIRAIDEDGDVHYGECGLFRGLSYDDRPGYEDKLCSVLRAFKADELQLEDLSEWPSILMGFEMLRDSLRRKHDPQDISPFHQGRPIAINGLIWMGDLGFMKSQMEEKIAQGYDCIKMKVGALHWQDEIELLKALRERHPSDELTLRVDANGAFTLNEASRRLQELADLDIHSIEQPIAAGQVQAMAKLCSSTPLPIALDEELIGVTGRRQKEELLDMIRPQFIILKPSLHGGFIGCDDWVDIAEASGIAWWTTSALESNIGLDAICRWTMTKDFKGHQGLGTGQLYENNIPSPLRVKGGYISYLEGESWNHTPIDEKSWTDI